MLTVGDLFLPVKRLFENAIAATPIPERPRNRLL